MKPLRLTTPYPVLRGRTVEERWTLLWAPWALALPPPTPACLHCACPSGSIRGTMGTTIQSTDATPVHLRSPTTSLPCRASCSYSSQALGLAPHPQGSCSPTHPTADTCGLGSLFIESPTILETDFHLKSWVSAGGRRAGGLRRSLKGEESPVPLESMWAPAWKWV